MKAALVGIILCILLISSIVQTVNISRIKLTVDRASTLLGDDSTLDSDFYGVNDGDIPKDSPSAAPPSAFSSPNGCFHLPPSSIQKISKLRIALVKPSFTTTAYSTDAFYTFYGRWAGVQTNENVTSGLKLLNVTLVDEWGISRPLVDFLSSPQASQCGIVLGQNLLTLDDTDVTQGTLAGTKARSYDVVILGFSEYVTKSEYAEFKNFVAKGGTLILMDAANFVAQVQFYPSSSHLALLIGHGWRQNGKSAWRFSPFEFWQPDNANWVGSNYCCYEPSDSLERASSMGAVANTSNSVSAALRTEFGEKVFASYNPHEENAIANGTDSIIAYFPPIKGHLVASYSHNYKLGQVLYIGIMSDDIIGKDSSAQFFLILSLLYGKPD